MHPAQYAALIRRLDALGTGMFGEDEWKEMVKEPSAANAFQARADYNRDNAGRLFPELESCIREGVKRWRTKDSKELVVFTPHGWLVESSDLPM